MMDARMFLDAERRRILKLAALALVIATGAVVLIMGAVFFFTANAGAGITGVASAIGGLGAGVTLALIGRIPLWLAMLPMLFALLLAPLAMALLLPELRLFFLACLVLSLSFCTLSNNQRLTLSIALVGSLLGIVIIFLPMPAGLTFSLGAALPAIFAVATLSAASVAAVLGERFIASQNAALALAEQRSAEAEIARAEAVIAHTEVERLQVGEQQRLIALVETLELPIIAVGAGMLVVPLVGELDSRRIVNIQGRLLDEVNRQRASTVVLDLTGVSLIDTHVAQQLVLMAQAVRLLGARILLSGIRADVAHTMVTLNIDLAGMRPVANLGAALQLNAIAA